MDGASEVLRAKLSDLPQETGVYVFLDEKGRVLYVGKAKNLRSRVRSYFTGPGDGRFYYDRIREETADLTFIATDSEKEALILENNLIKENRPPYNIVFRDDKAYLNLRISVKDPFPRLHKVRKIRRDGARYFGPYSSAGNLRRTLKILHGLFPVRTCTDTVFHNRSRPCLRFEVGLCTGPCAGRIDQAAYRRVVDDAILFLLGRSRDLLQELTRRMRAEAEALRFEEAARLRDAVRALEDTLARQKVVLHDLCDRDVFGLHREGDKLGLSVLFVREGRVIGSDAGLHSGHADDGDALESAILQFYTGDRTIPPEVLTSVELDRADTVAEILTERRGAPVTVHFPRRGPKRALVALACKNGAHAFRGAGTRRPEAALEEIARRLELPSWPVRIECFDVSHLGGTLAVGSMAVFIEGMPTTSEYRHFKIRTQAGADDFAMMAELISRRFGPGKADPPDLLLVDGGKGQLSAAQRALRELGRDEVVAAGIAKERHKTGGRIPDRIFVAGRPDPLEFPERSQGLYLLGRVRDEAHRFAVGYQRKLRRARTLRTGLEEIPGVGPTLARRLLRNFRSLKALRAAPVKEIARVKGVSEGLALTIFELLGGGERREEEGGKTKAELAPDAPPPQDGAGPNPGTSENPDT